MTAWLQESVGSSRLSTRMMQCCNESTFSSMNRHSHQLTGRVVESCFLQGEIETSIKSKYYGAGAIKA